MKARILGIVGLLVLAASAVWWWTDTREDPLPEGAIAGASLKITVGDPGFWPFTMAQTGVGVGALLLIISLIWMAATRNKNNATNDVTEPA